MIIDTHAHIYSSEFDEDREEVLKRAISAGVTRMYLPNVDSSTIDKMHELCDRSPIHCYPMMGLHPCSVHPETYESELKIVKDWLDKHPYAAVGEIGLDLYWDKSSYAEQVKALNFQCELALSHKLPVVLHSRNANAECIELIRPFAQKGLRGVFHCFSGNADEAAEITGMGFFLGIGGVFTYKKSGLEDAIKDIPNTFLVLETDAPYLSPVPYRGKRNEPAHVIHVLTALAASRGISYDEMAVITTTNALTLFNHP